MIEDTYTLKNITQNYMDSSLPILITDDDPASKHIMQVAFKEANFRNPTVFVFDGMETLNYLSACTSADKLPALVLLDLNMPKMGGMEVLKQIKAHELWCKIPVIIFSSSDYRGDIEQAYAHGAASYIVKPVDFDKLVSIMEMVNNYWFQAVRLPR
jgi:CheY-like chemotaxis protein